jgi:CBS domain-containing protein
VLYFTSLLAHELGQAVQARRDGVEIEGITLWLFGGVATFKGMFPSAGAELRIAIAGPAVSLLLGGLFVAVAIVGGLGSAGDGVAAWLGYINLLLRDFARATRIAADTGRGFGWFLIGVGLLLFIIGGAWSGAWLAFLGWFLLNAAAAEGRYGLLRDALGDLRVRDLMIRRPESVAADSTLAEFMDGIAHHHRFTTYPVVADERVVGLLPFASLARVPRRDWETTSVRDCMLGSDAVPHVREDESLLDAVADLQTGPIDRALVVADDHVVGLLSMTDLGRLVAAHQHPRRHQRAA